MPDHPLTPIRGRSTLGCLTFTNDLQWRSDIAGQPWAIGNVGPLREDAPEVGFEEIKNQRSASVALTLAKNARVGSRR